jgi:uncharacterized protein
VEFHGRQADLERLAEQLTQGAEGAGGARGQAVIVTGRRRVGKSRLVQELCDGSGAPYVVFQATRGRDPFAERADFIDAVGQVGLPSAELVSGLRPGDWNQALRGLAMALPDDRPSIAVIDELPWLTEQDSECEGALTSSSPRGGADPSGRRGGSPAARRA